MRAVDVVIVGASLSAAAAAKRLVDAGLETVILERQQLPRHKICSGILSPRGHRFLLENFGPLPREALHEPTWCRGVTFHFPSMVSMSMDFFEGSTPHLHRKYSDHWAIQRSGAQVDDQTSFVGLQDNGDHVLVHARTKGQERQYRARWVIGADGPSSLVIRALYPDYPKQIPWFFVGQKFHDIVDCPLDEAYFHFWFHPELGHYTWSHARDGRQIVGEGGERGPLAPRTVRYIHTIIHKALADAVDAGIAGANVAERAKPPRPNRGRSRQIECWEPAELARFLESARGSRLEAGWRLAAMTDMRRGEVLGLRWHDVDFDQSRIAVRNAIVTVAYEVLASSPKSHQARVIDLDPATMALLRRHREGQLQEREEFGAEYHDGDLVVCAEDGRPIHPQSFSQSFDRAVSRAGLRRIRLHDLRHTHATIAVKAGVPVKVISERLGHESPAFTLKQYAHVLPGMQAEAAELIAAAVAR